MAEKKSNRKIGQGKIAAGTIGGLSNAARLKRPSGNQVISLMVFAMLILAGWLALPYITDYLDERDKEKDAAQIKAEHTSDDPITVLPKTVGVTFNIPVASLTDSWYKGHGWSADEQGSEIRLYDNDPNTYNINEKTMFYTMITNASYRREVVQRILKPGNTGLSTTIINSDTTGKIWTNNEIPTQPFSGKYAKSDWFYIRVIVDYMDISGNPSGDRQNFSLSLPCFWSQNYKQDKATGDYTYLYDDTWIYVPLDPQITYDHLRITVTGSVKKVSDTANYVFGRLGSPGGFNRKKPGTNTAIGDLLIDNSKGNQVQPVVYYYPLEYIKNL